MSMTNPNGIVDGNSQNIPEANVPRTRSTFQLKYHLFNTHRFGELTPHYVEDCIKGDKLPIQSRHDIRSYTLAAPLMQNVKRNKDYFMVPMEAILPLNWEKFFDNPVRGDDVLDDVGPSVENFFSKVDTFYTNLLHQLSNSVLVSSSSYTDEECLMAALRCLIIGEYFYSNGSLLSSLGCHGAPYFAAVDANTGNRYSFDDFFDFFVNKIVIKYVDRFVLNVDGYSYGVVPVLPKHFIDRHAIDFRHALSLMRDNPTFTISNYANTSDLPASSSLKAEIASFFSNSSYVTNVYSGNFAVDLSRLWAYQLCCAHYMSNDHIDFVYSAELYRQLIGSYLKAMLTFNSQFTFVRNGVTYFYDHLSAKGFASALTTMNSSSALVNLLTSSNSTLVLSQLGYLSALFGYRRSLRYLDYFTGTRTQPLAVVTSGISTNVSVNNNAVSVIDITKSIQAQRFLNAVNRVRHNFEGYLKGIFGGEMPAPDYHNPFYIAHTDDVIFGQETENTGAAQVDPDTPIAVTTNLRGNSGNYVFNVEVDRPAIVIGITSYDITRVYSQSIERSFFKQNRFDYFNPFMQYVGDQPVYLQELGISPIGVQVQNLSNFGYSLRHMEYKQRYSQCAGGFVEYLPNWLFTALDERGNQMNINPDWIRAIPAEFDRFYKVLSGYSLATYFHFIVDDYNSCNASRPMAYAPNIL